MKTIINKKSLQTLYRSLLLPYLTYCVEVWGNSYKTIINPIYILQKKAIRIVNLSDYYAPTNPLFIDNCTLKFQDIVNLNTTSIIYKAYNKSLPGCMQELFKPREGKYDLRGTAIFKKTKVRTNAMGRCISVIGVNLWNQLDNELKLANSIKTYKKIYKAKVIDTYIAAERTH